LPPQVPGVNVPCEKKYPLQSVAEGAEIAHVGAVDDEAELGERKEDNEQHDGEGDEVFSRTVDCNRYDTH